jgi:hypothetical protein
MFCTHLLKLQLVCIHISLPTYTDLGLFRTVSEYFNLTYMVKIVFLCYVLKIYIINHGKKKESDNLIL